MTKTNNPRIWMWEKAVENGVIQIDSRVFDYAIVPTPIGGGFNGYCFFDIKPLREDSYRGIACYVPVHGGITFAVASGKGMVYGFDTAHCDSEEYPRDDRTWIKEQIKVMIRGLLMASEVEAKYLRCVSNKGKAKYAQMVSDIGALEHRMNFGVNLNLLAGQL